MARDFPCSCTDCPDDGDQRQRYGCGVSQWVPWTPTARGSGFAGKAVADYDHGAPGGRRDPQDEAWHRTCPQYYRRSPFVASILSDLEDYRANRLGNVMRLPESYLTYLRVADAEARAWHDWWQEERLPSA